MRLVLGFVVAILLSLPAMAETITLSKDNTVTLREPFYSDTVTPLQAKLLNLDKTMRDGEPLYLFLSTPGGSIDAGMDLIRVGKSLNREVKTITHFAASMGFITVQNLGERLTLDNGILMAHRAKAGIAGQIPGELDTRYNFLKQEISYVEDTVKNRINMTEDNYRAMVENEHWTYGKASVKENLADRIVEVKCGQDLRGTYTEEQIIFIFKLRITWSECPLITEPLSIDINFLFDNKKKNSEDNYISIQDTNRIQELLTKDEVEQIKAIRMMYYDKIGFLNEYIITGKYMDLRR